MERVHLSLTSGCTTACPGMDCCLRSRRLLLAAFPGVSVITDHAQMLYARRSSCWSSCTFLRLGICMTLKDQWEYGGLHIQHQRLGISITLYQACRNYSAHSQVCCRDLAMHTMAIRLLSKKKKHLRGRLSLPKRTVQGRLCIFVSSSGLRFIGLGRSGLTSSYMFSGLQFILNMFTPKLVLRCYSQASGHRLRLLPK